jgi:hypothetical protein
MKRLIPLWITALGGFVLIVAYFIPVTQGWGEVAAIWFDILAAIAFILGGGNLLKIHLKKTSDRAKGWGYSVVVAGSFLTMLYVGLVKWGAPPAPMQEFFGETFAALPVDSIPDNLVFEIDGPIPVKPGGEPLHASVRQQISEQDGTIIFRGWMLRDQKIKLLTHWDHLDWQCTVNTLFERTQPAPPLTGRVAFYADHEALSFKGHMTGEQKAALLDLNGDEHWNAAVEDLYDKSQTVTSEAITVDRLPPLFNAADPAPDVDWDAPASSLSVQGPMTAGQLDALASLFPHARPLVGAERQALLDRIRTLGPVTDSQVEAFNKVLDGSWTVEQLRRVLDEAGKTEVVPRTVCDMLTDQAAGMTDIPLTERVGEDWTLNDAQVALLGRFAADESMSVSDLSARLGDAGNFKGAQAEALESFMGTVPTAGARMKDLCFAMMKALDRNDDRQPLNAEQRGLLLADYRSQMAWRLAVGRLSVKAHVRKYPWSGEYRAQGAPFWWLYEYAFKPLQATTFAMLAFYVASAAFRAFRAKNIEAMLLLGTAFIILLGRTFAGVFLTAWLPEWLSGLKIENLSVYIMQVFNTAGNRAIMIGIALGIASTSLKVLLGVDRSYLGSGEE